MSHEANEYDVDQTAHGPVEDENEYDPYYLGGARKKKTRSYSGCLAVLVALIVVLGGAAVLGTKGFHYLKDHLQHSADYPGPGHGRVLFEVKDGDSTSAIGRNLKNQNVVASVGTLVAQLWSAGFYYPKSRA